MKYINKDRITYCTLLCVVLLLSSCVNTLELVAPQGERRVMSHEGAVADAKAYFDTHFGQNTRSNNQAPTEEAPYAVGNLVPDWESGVTVANEHKTHTDFAMQKDFRYFLLLGENEEGQMQGVELYSRFVSVEDYSLGATSQYVATYIPDEEYLKSYGAVAQDYGINCAEWYEFSGVVLYTLPSGHHVAAYRYEGGELVDRSFLYDREQTNEENIADFVSVMEGLMLGVARANNGTRTDVEILYFGGVGDTIIETAYTKDYSDHFYKAPLPEDCPVVEAVITDRTTAISILGGGGSGSTSTEKKKLDSKEFADKILKNTLSPSDSMRLHTMLTEILNDCMGQTMLQEIYDKGTQINITFNSNISRSKYKFNSNIHSSTIVMCNDHSEGLVHELFHFVQHYTLGYNTYQSAYVNFEVEAHIASLMYMSHTTNISAHSRYDKYCDTTWGGYQEDCALYLNADGSIPQGDFWEEMFRSSYDDAAWYYKGTHQNRNYDTNRNSEDNISILSKLFKYCN